MGRPTFGECFAFPVSSPEARRDLIAGGTFLLAPIAGWILNLGHRLEVIGRLCRSNPPYFRGFGRPPGRVFRRGLHAFGAILLYLSPSALAALAAVAARQSGGALVLDAPATATGASPVSSCGEL